MGFIRGTLKTTALVKIMDLVRREAAKPQNQAKARELMAKARTRASSARTASGRRPVTTTRPGTTPWGRLTSSSRTKTGR